VAFVILPLKSIVGEELKDFNDLGVPEIKLFIDHGPKSIQDAAWAYRAGGGGAAAPQFVGQTKPVGQYSLHSWAILAYYKNKWDKFCRFCGKFC
jgi:hypothetical protein